MKMTLSDMELAAKYLRTNDVGDAAGNACGRIATALEDRVAKGRQRIIKAAMTDPPNRAKPGNKTSGDWAEGSAGRYRK